MDGGEEVDAPPRTCWGAGGMRRGGHVLGTGCAGGGDHGEPHRSGLAPGSSLRLVAKALDEAGQEVPDVPLTWRSEDSLVVRVSEAGLVTALRPGTTRVWAAGAGRAGAARIVVPQPPPGAVATVHMGPAVVEIYPGQTAGFEVVAMDANGVVVPGRAVTWSVSDPRILLLDAAGGITGAWPGTAVVNAIVDGVAGAAVVTVLYPAPVLDSVAPASLPSEAAAPRSGFAAWATHRSPWCGWRVRP